MFHKLFMKLVCLFRQHDYKLILVNEFYYDREVYLECKRCGKEREL